MKTTILILLAAVSIARANLIDLTPGGFDETQPYPQAFWQFIERESYNRITFFDAAHPTGWDSINGALNGGTYFNTDLPGNPGSSANVSWDFTTLPGWNMSILLVEGELWYLDGVRNASELTDLSDEITLHDGVNIQSLAFYGRNPESAPVPDSGSTLALMGMGLLGIFVYARRVNASASDVSRLQRLPSLSLRNPRSLSFRGAFAPDRFIHFSILSAPNP